VALLGLCRQMVREQVPSARILDLLSPPEHLVHRGRGRPCGVPEIDHEEECLPRRLVLKHRLRGRVRDAATIPVVAALDLGRGEAGRQRAAGQHVFWANRLFGAVEGHELPRLDVGRTQRQPHRSRIDQVEVDQPAERLQHRRGVVEAGLCGGASREEHRVQGPRPKEVRLAHDQGFHIAHRVVEDVQRQHSQRLDHLRPGDQAPQLLKPSQALRRRGAGEDGAVDGTDGDTGEPVRLEAVFGQGLVSADVVGAERAAALQGEHACRFSRDCRQDFRHDRDFLRCGRASDRPD
jgi:hypothetical protein